MATVGRRTLLVNGKRRNRKRRNRAKRKMSAKQIRIFGTKAQKAALRRRKTRPNRPKKKASRPRTRPRKAPKRKARRAKRKNVSSIITASLAGLAGNPGGRKHKKKARPNKKRKATMAKTRRTKKSAGRRSQHRSKARSRKNAYRPKRRQTRHSHRARRNPSFGGITTFLIDAGWTAVGGVGSRTLTQFALGSSNTGLMGYGANLLSGLLISFGVRSALKNPNASRQVMIGTMLGILFRAVQDFTPFGQYASLSGLGDFMTTTFFAPRGFVSSGKSGQIVTPRAITDAVAASAAAAATAVPAGRRGMGNFYGRSMYR